MTKFKKTIASFAGFAIALSMFAVVAAPVANAATIDDLLAQITNLTAQLNALKGTSSTVSFTFTRNLTIDSTGADVTALQTWLIGKGYSIPAGATGYFGTQTKMALSQYQAAKGIVPAVGYFGPITMAKVSSEMTVANPGNPSNPTNPVTGLSGTDGSIDDVNEIGSYNNEEVGEGENDVKVAGIEVETSNDGDIALRSIKVEFTENGSGDSDNLDDYIDGVSIWMGDKKIGSADVEDFTEGDSGVFTKTVTLSGAVIKADDTENVYIAVDAVNSFDSGDIDGLDWSVDVSSIRFEDGSGVVTTDDSTGDIGTVDVAIDFVTFSTSADTELKISLASDSPEASVVIVDESDTTDGVVLLKGKLTLDGTSDVNLDEFPVTFTVTGTTGLASTTGSVTLKLGSNEYTESVGSSFNTLVSTVTFDNLDFDISAGGSVNFTVSADIEDTDSDLDNGDTLLASVTASNRALIDAENEEGDQLDDSSEKSGTAIGEAQEFRTEGIQVTLISTETDATVGTSSNDDVGLFTIKYKVKAIGNTVYVSSISTDGTSVDWAVDKSGTATSANSISATLVNKTDTDMTSVGNFQIDEGQEETFELSVSVPLGTGGTSGQYRSTIAGLLWDTSDDTSMANTYTQNLDDFRTSYKVLN